MTKTAICLHTEALHDERVWERMRQALDEMEKRDVKVTFLVYPLRSVAAGVEVRDRVKELATRGHEVGQHTHFYAGLETERTQKRIDLSDDNVRACILRDYEWLAGCGVEPKGFCAGNSMTTETVYETLAELRFLYDCSARLPWERKSYELPQPFLEGAQVRSFKGVPLVLLPSTEYLTIAQCVHPSRRRRNASLSGETGRYRLVINHDYDLPIGKVWLGLIWMLRRASGMMTARQLAEFCVGGGGDGH